MATFFDLLEILTIVGLLGQIKIAMGLMALIRIKKTRSDLKGSFCVHPIIVYITLALLIIITIVAIYANPFVMGTGFLLFLCGIPLYMLKKFLNCNYFKSWQDYLTILIQKVTMSVPGDCDVGKHS